MPIQSSKRAPESASTSQRSELTEVVDDLRRIVRALRESSREAERDLGVSGAQLFVLRALGGEAALSVNQLAERTSTHQSTVSVVVRRLVTAGLVKSRAASDDARRLELSLSARGRKLLERAPAAAQEKLLTGFAALSREQQLQLKASLSAWVSAMQLPAAKTTMFFEDSEHDESAS